MPYIRIVNSQISFKVNGRSVDIYARIENVSKAKSNRLQAF